VVSDDILNELKFPPRANEEKYPWKKWFDGSVWLIKQGEDFDVDIESMRSAIYMAASRHEVKVRTHVPKQRNSIYVQKLGKKESNDGT
jgi:hypothetical protein